MSFSRTPEDCAKSRKFDNFMLNVVDTNRGIDGFLDAVFGFLGRSTDFFTREQVAFDTVNDCMTKHIKIFRENKKLHEALEKK